MTDASARQWSLRLTPSPQGGAAISYVFGPGAVIDELVNDAFSPSALT